ncbi:MAG: acetate--CoA ligase family protein [bacterium]
MKASLEHFFKPRAVAVIGASRVPGKVGFDLMRNVTGGDYRGRVYPVNPKAKELFGLKCYPGVREIEGEFDLAVVMIPPRQIPGTLVECGAKGADAAIIISAGFKEVGPEGAGIEREMLAAAKGAGIRLLGPNCLGLIDTYSGLNASFAAGTPGKGSIGFVSQSGALCTAILDWSFARGMGFSKFISLGNKADVDEVDVLDALGDDAETSVIIGYLEGTSRGRAFMETALRVTKSKPVVLIKSGVSEAGAKAASSHTGSMAGSDAAYDAAFRQCGVIRAETVEELFDYASAFAYQPLPEGERVAILTNAGGPGIMATDSLRGTCAQMAVFSPETVARLKEALPPTAAVYNPVDIIGDARADRYSSAIEALLSDPGVHGLVILLTPQGMTQIEETAKNIAYAALTHSKPLLAAFMGEDMVGSGIHILNKNRIPNYGFPERAVAVFSRMAEHAFWRKKAAPAPAKARYPKKEIAGMLGEFRRKGTTAISGEKALRIVKALGIRVPEYSVGENLDEAKAAAGRFGYPVVMKVSSPDISHKSDVGGVAVGIADEERLEEAYHRILFNCRKYVPNAVVQGVEIHEMVRGGKELICGMTRDAQFGPLVVFGLGGIYVEILKDVCFRVAPLSEDDIEQMIYGIKSAALLTGARGEPPKDVAAVRETLRLISSLAVDFDEIVEMDVNPLMVLEEGKGVYAIDARFSVMPS